MNDTATAPALETPPSSPPPSDLDSLGRAFDASKFLPEKDKIGRWKNKNAGKRAPFTRSDPHDGTHVGHSPFGKGNVGVVGAPPSAEPPPADFSDVERAASGGTAKAAEAVVMDENATADTAIGIIQTALVLIGDEEGVLSDAEKILLRRPLVRVLEKYKIGKDVLPVEIDLALALAGIVVARLQKPKTATWFMKVKTWILNFWFRRKGNVLASEVRQHAAPAATHAP